MDGGRAENRCVCVCFISLLLRFELYIIGGASGRKGIFDFVTFFFIIMMAR